MAPLRIFVSYNHEADSRWFEQEYYGERPLIPWLAHMLRNQDVRFWYDRASLGVGDQFRQEIEAQIDQADIAILLVSRGFMLSTFIQEVELPRIEARAQRRELTVVPIITRHCPWQEIPLLNSVVVMPSSTTPLVNYTSDEVSFLNVKDELLAGIERQIEKIRSRQEQTREPDTKVVDAPPSTPAEPPTARGTAPRVGLAATVSTLAKRLNLRSWVTRTNIAIAAAALILLVVVAVVLPRSRRSPGPGGAGGAAPAAVGEGMEEAIEAARRRMPARAEPGEGDLAGDFLLVHEPEPIDTGQDLSAAVTSEDGETVSLQSPAVLMSRKSSYISLSPQRGVYVKLSSLPVEMSCGILEVPMALVASLARLAEAATAESEDGPKWLLVLRGGERFLIRDVDWPEVAPQLTGEGTLGEMSFSFGQLSAVEFEGGQWRPPTDEGETVALTIITDTGVECVLSCRNERGFDFAIGDGTLTAQPRAIGEIVRLGKKGDYGATHVLMTEGEQPIGVAAREDWLNEPPTGRLGTASCQAPMGSVYLSMSGWASIRGLGQPLATDRTGRAVTMTDTVGAQLRLAGPKLKHSYSTGMFSTFMEHTQELDYLPLDTGNTIVLLPLADLSALSMTVGPEDERTWEAVMNGGRHVRGVLPHLEGSSAFGLRAELAGEAWCGSAAWPLVELVSATFSGRAEKAEVLGLPGGPRATVTFSDGEQVRLDMASACNWGEDGKLNPRTALPLVLAGGETSVELTKLSAINDLAPDKEYPVPGARTRGTSVAKDGAKLSASLEITTGPCLAGRSEGMTVVAPFERMASVKFTAR